ncbi:hypothetical protein BpHYR1_036256, partial [Brachionus plicatilis]
FLPTILIADGSDAITNGYELAFGKPSERIMCWAHVLRNVNEHLVSIPSETRNAIKSDIMVIQLSINEDIFKAAIRLFCDKWLLQNDSLVENFIKHFKEQWFTKQPGWYEGHALGYPSSNNALESTNRYIKEQSTFKDRLSVTRLDPAEKNYKAFKTQVEIRLADWTATAQWLQRKQSVIKHKINNNLKLYFVGNKNNQQIDQTYVDNWMTVHLNCDRDEFEDYKNHEPLLYVIVPDLVDFKSGKCSCIWYIKNNICKHLIGISKILNIPECEIPLSAKNIPIGEKRNLEDLQRQNKP